MMSKKLHFVFDKTDKANQQKRKLLRKFKSYAPHEADTIVVLGGDGFMLQTLKKLGKFNKSFYGINMGTYGFLMNKFKTRKFMENLSKSKPITISALQMIVKSKNNIAKKAIAINEISMFRQSKQAATIQIKKGKKIIMKKLSSDGVLVATPAGSTAYNLSVHGPILSLNSKKLAITPISPFRPRRWKGTIVSDRSVINISNLNIKKRPVSVVADNVEFRNIKNVKIYINRKIKFNLLYDSKNSLNKKIKIEQVRKEIN
jgi:NAD+ kinase